MKIARRKDRRGCWKMFLNFIAEEKQRYIILREYYVSNTKEKGMFFLVKHEDNQDIKLIFLSEEELDNEYIPRRAKRGDDVRYKASALEFGQENVLIVETGVWRKRGVFQKIKNVPSKRYRYVLKK